LVYIELVGFRNREFVTSCRIARSNVWSSLGKKKKKEKEEISRAYISRIGHNEINGQTVLRFLSLPFLEIDFAFLGNLPGRIIRHGMQMLIAPSIRPFIFRFQQLDVNRGLGRTVFIDEIA